MSFLLMMKSSNSLWLSFSAYCINYKSNSGTNLSLSRVKSSAYCSMEASKKNCPIKSENFTSFYLRSEAGEDAKTFVKLSARNFSTFFFGGFGPTRCTIDNGDCWSETRYGLSFSACSNSELSGCKCPNGFQGDGHSCKDIDECKEHTACQCDDCSCKNTWGGYECKCKWDLLYMKEQDTCIERHGSRFSWFVAIIVLSALIGVGIGIYVFYKYRLRSYMDSEIMAIMSQYMPLDNHQNNEVQIVQTETLRHDFGSSI